MQIGDDVRAIPEADLLGHDFTAREVAAVYRDPSERWLHVLVASDPPGVHLVVVVGGPRGSVHGHDVLEA